jgi:hypothetical protein
MAAVEGHPEHAGPRLLVLGAGATELDLLAAARERGLFVVAVDRNASAPGFQLAHRRALISADDEPAIHRLAEAERIDGVVAGCDAAVGIAARVARRCALSHPLDPETAVRACSKLRQRERLVEAAIPHVPWRLAGDRVEDLGEGPELQVHGFSLDGRFHELAPAARGEAAVLAAAAVAALGIRTGPTETNVRIAPEGLQVVEIVARLAPDAAAPGLAALVVAAALGERIAEADLVRFAAAHAGSTNSIEAAA